jgi:hypothetical protein
MTQRTHAPQIGWGRSAWYGAEAGIALSFLYALAFIGYAVVRSTLNLLAIPKPDGGLAATLIATWLTLAVAAFVLAALVGILAALIGALTALALRALLSNVDAAQTPRGAIVIAVALCLSISVTLLVLLNQGLDVALTPATDPMLTFWLVVPLVIYVVAGGIASWEVNRMIGE